MSRSSGGTRGGTLRVGLIGLGLRGSVGTHIEGSGLGQVVAVCDPVRSRREEALRIYPGAEAVADHRDLVGAELDAVVITTPDDTHEHLAVQFLQAGIPTFVDKPLAITTSGCDRVLEAAHASGTALYVGHNMRHMPVITTMREVIRSGAIGEVKAVWCRHFVGHGGDYYFKDWHADRRRTTGLLLQKGAHDIDIIHWLAGAFTTRTNAMGTLAVYGDLTARGGQGERTMLDWFDPEVWPPAKQSGLNDVIDVEDLSMMTMQLDNGVLASYQQCHFTPDYWRNYTVIGTQGRLENFGDSDGAVLKVWNSGRSGYREAADRELEVPTGTGGHGGADPRLLAEFLAHVADGSSTLTSPVAARAAVAAAAAATESLRHGGTPVDVPPLPAKLRAYFEQTVATT